MGKIIPAGLMVAICIFPKKNSSDSRSTVTFRKSLPRHLTIREFAADFRGLLIGGPDHDSFFDYVDNVHPVPRIQQENLIGLRRREDSSTRIHRWLT
jgi:hypothetical protein